MRDDTALVRMVIDGIAKKNNWTYEEAIEKFYNSDTCRVLSDRETGVFTFSHRDVIELFGEGFAL